MKKSERLVEGLLYEETHEGQYGEYKRYRIGKMYVLPMDILNQKVSRSTLAKHVANQERLRAQNNENKEEKGEEDHG